VFVHFFFEVLENTQTYNSFLKAWASITMILSKLRSIPKVLDSNNRSELHPLFQIVELNLPKEIAEKLLH
jgi:hypothetical protein